MIGYLFSGQGSQKPHMTDDLCAFSKDANRLVEKVSELAGFEIKNLSDEMLAQTRYAQLAIVTTSLAAWAAWQEKLVSGNAGNVIPKEVSFAGFSLGEYSMLSAAGILGLKDLVELVSVRSELMQEAAKKNPGAMYAVLGLETEQIENILKAPELADMVYAVNYNCPGQTVISGLQSEAALASERLKTAGARRCLKLNVSGAFHTRFMQSAADGLEMYARTLKFNSNISGVYSNITSEPLASRTDWPAYLAEHLCRPVYWSQEISRMSADGTNFMLEMGYGKVLTGLVKKINRNLPVWPVESEATLMEAWLAWQES